MVRVGVGPLGGEGALVTAAVAAEPRYPCGGDAGPVGYAAIRRTGHPPAAPPLPRALQAAEGHYVGEGHEFAGHPPYAVAVRTGHDVGDGVPAGVGDEGAVVQTDRQSHDDTAEEISLRSARSAWAPLTHWA